MRARPGVKLLSAALVVASFSAFFFACGRQGEGERCDALNGNDDCQDGLICGQRVCCPPAGVQATSIDCLNSSLPQSDSGIGDATDTGSSGDARDGGDSAVDATDAADSKDAADAADAGGDTGSDAGSDTGSDVGSDVGTDSADAG